MIEVTEEETKLIKNRFDRMYPRDTSLTDNEAVTIVRALKEGRQWLRVLKEENCPR